MRGPCASATAASLERFGLEPDHLGAARRALDEVTGQDRHVLGSLPQRRQRQRDDAQAVEQVGAETPRAHLRREIAVGRGDQPHVDRLRVDRAQRPHLALLDRAEQLRLEPERQLAHLVEEQRAPLRGAEQTLGVAHRAGERAAQVAEQLALDHALGQRPAVDRHEGPAAARRGLVDRTRQELLAGAALGLDQHVALVRGEVAHGLQHPAHGRGLRDHALQRRAPAELALELAVAHAQAPPRERALERLHHPARIGEGLLEVVERAGAHARDHGVDAGVAGHHDDLGVGPALAQLAQQLEPRRLAQPQVEQHDLRLLRELSAHQAHVAGLEHRIAAALELAAESAHDRRLVVRHQHAGAGAGAAVARRIGGHPRRNRSGRRRA